MRVYIESTLRSLESAFFLMSKLDRISNEDIVWLLWRKGGHFSTPRAHLQLIEVENPNNICLIAFKDRLNETPVIYWGGDLTSVDEGILRRNFNFEEFWNLVNFLGIQDMLSPSASIEFSRSEFA